MHIHSCSMYIIRHPHCMCTHTLGASMLSFTNGNEVNEPLLHQSGPRTALRALKRHLIHSALCLPLQVKLSRLCEQDKILKELEARISTLKEDKVNWSITGPLSIDMWYMTTNRRLSVQREFTESTYSQTLNGGKHGRMSESLY